MGPNQQGEKAQDPVRVEGAWPALVSREMFDAVQEAMRDRAPKVQRPARVGSRFLLSGLLKCGVCGRPYSGQGAKSGQFAYYICGTLFREGSGTCSARYLNAPRVEDFVVEKIRERILTEETIVELVTLVAEEVDAMAGEMSGRLEVIDAELGDVRNRLEKLYEALETSELTLEVLSPRIFSLRHREEQLEAAREDAERQIEQRRVELPTTEEIKEYVSDKSQDGEDKTSISEQTGDMEAFCESKGLTITARYQEVGRGWSKKRPEFQRMLADAKRGRFDTIVCWKSDRLSRGMYPAAALMEVVEAHQIRLEAVLDAIGMKTFGLMAAIGKIELDNFRERSTMGKRGTAKQGRVPTGGLPYGYRIGDDGRPEVVEEQAEVVRHIFRMYVDEGMRAYSIAVRLTDEGIPTQTGKLMWLQSRVHHILGNATYAARGSTESTAMSPPRTA